jgi:serine/threonine protein kinase
MAGINAIHEAGIIHCDLKPPNIYLFRDPDIEAGYRLKVIDMDFSILKDVPAPWHGSDTGYVGTPRYFSPEHLKGEVPVQASDVFTCGVILYELLTGKHPYADESTYTASAIGWRAPAPALLGQINDSAELTETVRKLLHLCLHPDPKTRPTAKDVNLALRGRCVGTLAYPPVSGPPPEMEPTRKPETAIPPPPPPHERGLQPLGLCCGDGKALTCSIRTDVGKHVCSGLGDDAKYMHDTMQFTLVPDQEAGSWMLHPNAGAKNQTILNGKAVSAPVRLNPGDVVGVGNEAKGIVKLPLTVRIAAGK